MTFGCMLITTNVSRRIKYITNAINSIDLCGVKFDQKILSVDMFEDGKSKSFFDKFKGWEIVFGKANGMINNQSRGLRLVNTDYMLYSEDKVIVEKIPSKEVIDKMLRVFSYVCFNMHMCENFCEPPQEVIDYINDKKNYIYIQDELFLIKNSSLADNYFLNFPVSISKTEVFKTIHAQAVKNYPNLATEVSMTKVWLDKFRHLGNVGIYTRNDTLIKIPMNLMDLFYQSNMKYWNNCPELRVKSIHQTGGRLDPEYLRRLKILEDYERKMCNDIA